MSLFALTDLTIHSRTPPEWEKLVVIRLENGNIKVKDLPLDYWLKPPYAPTYEENYRKHSGL